MEIGKACRYLILKFVIKGIIYPMLMRKNILVFAALCLLTVQPLLAQKKSEVKLGLKFAPNISFINPSTNEYKYDGAKLGAVIGLVSDIYFAEHYAFSTGFNFSFLGGKMTYPDKVMRDTLAIKGTTNSNLSAIYIEIPMMIKMFTKKFGKFSFFGQVGFGTGFRIAGHVNTDFTGSNGYSVSEKVSAANQTTTIRESVIIGLGTEIYLDESTRLVVGLGYSNSLNNVLKGYNALSGLNQKGYLNYAELNLGVMF